MIQCDNSPNCSIYGIKGSTSNLRAFQNLQRIDQIAVVFMHSPTFVVTLGDLFDLYEEEKSRIDEAKKNKEKIAGLIQIL